MTVLRFPYVEAEHPVWGTISRPVIQLQLFSERFGEWLLLEKVLADTGADVSVVPLPLGQVLVTDVEQGQPIRLGGIVTAAAQFNAHLHVIQARLDEQIFNLPVTIALTGAVPPVFGRYSALDRFTARFVGGEEMIIET